MGERIVLLGHTGFLGHALYTLLQREQRDVQGFSSATVDLRQAEALRRFNDLFDRSTIVIFASALTPDKGATLDILEANLDMAMNVARYLRAHPVGRCLYVSTDAVYPLDASPITEETPVEPSNFNALAKYAGECMLRQIAESTGTPLLVLRLTPLYGPGDTHGSYGPNQFMRTILKEGIVRLFGEGEEQRDHLYVDDAARLILELLRKEATGTINLATGQSYSFVHVVDTLRRTVPVPFTVASMPRKMPVMHRHFDTTRLFVTVPGFRFTSLEEGLRTYYAASCRVPTG